MICCKDTINYLIISAPMAVKMTVGRAMNSRAMKYLDILRAKFSKMRKMLNKK